jgi:TrmH family RNA methyltransferase
MFLVEGPHAVAEALASPRHQVVELFLTPTAADRETDLLRVAAGNDIPVSLVTDRVAASLSDTVTPQGVVAVVRAGADSLDLVLAANPRLLVVLVDVADPGNVGTVIRTADAAGADAVVLAGHSVDPHNPKVVRASAGSLFHLPVPRADATETLTALRRHDVQVVATTLDGEADLFDVAAAGGLGQPLAWLLGNEAHGLPAEVAAAADLTVRIPIRGQAESLNLAAAAAVCLYVTAQAQSDRSTP